MSVDADRGRPFAADDRDRNVFDAPRLDASRDRWPVLVDPRHEPFSRPSVDALIVSLAAPETTCQQSMGTQAGASEGGLLPGTAPSDGGRIPSRGPPTSTASSVAQSRSGSCRCNAPVNFETCIAQPQDRPRDRSRRAALAARSRRRGDRMKRRGVHHAARGRGCGVATASGRPGLD